MGKLKQRYIYLNVLEGGQTQIGYGSERTIVWDDRDEYRIINYTGADLLKITTTLHDVGTKYRVDDSGAIQLYYDFLLETGYNKTDLKELLNGLVKEFDSIKYCISYINDPQTFCTYWLVDDNSSKDGDYESFFIPMSNLKYKFPHLTKPFLFNGS